MTEADPQGATVASTNRRRSQRVTIGIPVTISGGAGSLGFSQLTATVTVSPNGCLVLLDAPVVRSQELLVTCPGTQQKALGTVAYIGSDTSKIREVGIEFLEPSPTFWKITFPPENWDPSERKLPTREAPLPARPGRLR
jgi:PilZ domain